MATALVEKVRHTAVAVQRLAAEGLQLVWHREQNESGRTETSFRISAQHKL